MKKVISKIEFDTDASTLVQAYSYGKLGDPDGYEEDL